MNTNHEYSGWREAIADTANAAKWLIAGSVIGLAIYHILDRLNLTGYFL